MNPRQTTTSILGVPLAAIALWGIFLAVWGPTDGSTPLSKRNQVVTVHSADRTEADRRRAADAEVERKLWETRLDFAYSGESREQMLRMLVGQVEIELRIVPTKVRYEGFSLKDRVACELAQVRAETLLRLLLEGTEYGYEVRQGELRIAESNDTEPIVNRFYPALDFMQFERGRLQPAALIEAITSTLQPESWEQLGGEGVVEAVDHGFMVGHSPRMQRMIQHLIETLRAAREMPNDHYDISPIAIAADPAAYAECLRKMGTARITIDVEGTTLQTVARTLFLKSDVNIHLRYAELADIKLNGSWQDQPLDHILNDLAEEFELSWTIEDDLVVINSPGIDSTAEGHHEVKVYPCRDLLRAEPFEPLEDGAAHLGSVGGMVNPLMHRPQFLAFDKSDDLIEALTAIEPESWEELGGPGTLTEVEESECLVICQSPQVHEQIEQFFQQLRANRPPPGALDQLEKQLPLEVRSYFQSRKLTREELTQLAERIRELIEPQSWDGEGTFIDVVGDRLLIRQSPRVHQKIGESVLVR